MFKKTRWLIIGMLLVHSAWSVQQFALYYGYWGILGIAILSLGVVFELTSALGLAFSWSWSQYIFYVVAAATATGWGYGTLVAQ